MPASRGDSVLRALPLAAELFLVAFPAGHLLPLPVAGAGATAGDVVLLLLLLVWALEAVGGLAAMDRPGGAHRNGAPAWGPPLRFHLGVGFLVLFACWAALSGTWGFHARYAAAKGAGMGALALGAAALASSGLPWERALGAWLRGAGLALALALGLVLTDAGRGLALHGGGGVWGLPLPRPRAPFPHPNMLADYLVVTGVLLWIRWSALPAGGRRWGALLLGGAGAAALALTVSTAWFGAGVAAVLLAGAGATGGARRIVRLAGAAVAGATLVAALVPVDLTPLGLGLGTSGIRPAIWRASLEAVAVAPLAGVGASPYVAAIADPLRDGAVGLWDAHNAYLSVLAQFGLVGAALAAAGVALVVTSALRAVPPGRTRRGLAAAFAAVAAHACLAASEDMRHVWVLLGLAGLAAASGASAGGLAARADGSGASPGAA